MDKLNNNNLLIEYEKVEQTAANINEYAKQMATILNDFSNRMSDLKAREIIVGNSADTLESKFNELKKKFDSYLQVVQDSSKAITYTKNTTKQTENVIEQDAENLPK